MKSRRLIFSVVALVAILVITASPVLAAGKTQDVIAKSNGFPSGMHFNLNIHGVLNLYAEDPCTHEAGGNSVFIDLYGTNIIQYQSGKKVSGTELVAIDPCASGDGKVAVQLPSKVLVYDEATMLYNQVPVAGYYVYGRILGKPQNGGNKDVESRSNIIFSPNMVTDAYNTIGEGDELVNLGLVTWNATYYAGSDAYYRFADSTSTAKGKSIANNMSHLFTFTGWVVDASLDADLDGVMTINDIPLADYGSGIPSHDFNNDGYENDADVTAWLVALDADPLTTGLVTEYTNEWIFNIADFVTTEGEVTNDGTKLFQVRFYPYFE